MLNLADNRLNQTGIYHALKTAIHCNQLGGYFNAKDQQVRSGPENAVIYRGVHTYPGRDGNDILITGRPDAYIYSSTPYYEENAPPIDNERFQDLNMNTPCDLNNRILDLAQHLRWKGWEVELDYSDEKYNINGNFTPDYTFVNNVETRIREVFNINDTIESLVDKRNRQFMLPESEYGSGPRQPYEY